MTTPTALAKTGLPEPAGDQVSLKTKKASKTSRKQLNTSADAPKAAKASRKSKSPRRLAPATEVASTAADSQPRDGEKKKTKKKKKKGSYRALRGVSSSKTDKEREFRKAEIHRMCRAMAPGYRFGHGSLDALLRAAEDFQINLFRTGSITGDRKTYDTAMLHRSARALDPALYQQFLKHITSTAVDELADLYSTSE